MTDPLALQLSLDRLHLTRDIVVAAAASGRPIDLAAAIKEVHAALSGLADEAPTPAAELTPAVPIKKSVFPDRIISLETGQVFKSLKRHLRGLGMTPDEYRKKWGLPADYPMVCSDYSAKRSQLAKNSGLGRTK